MEMPGKDLSNSCFFQKHIAAFKLTLSFVKFNKLNYLPTNILKIRYLNDRIYFEISMLICKYLLLNMHSFK